MNWYLLGGIAVGVVFLILLGYAMRELAKEVYYVKGKPYFRLDELKDKGILARLKNVVRKGPFVEAEDDYLLEATLTHKGKMVAKLMFFPEALSIMDPVKFMAEFAGIDPSEVEAVRANRKLVISGREYALVFEEAPKVEIHRDCNCSGEFAAGYSLGSA